MWPNKEDIADLDSIVCGMHFSVYDQAIYIAFHNGDIVSVHLDSSEEEVKYKIFNQIILFISIIYVFFLKKKIG